MACGRYDQRKRAMQNTHRFNSTDSIEHPAVWMAGACCIGIGTDRWLDCWIGLYASIAVVALVFVFGLPGGRLALCFRLISILIFIGALSASWHHVYWNYYPENEISCWATDDSRPVCLRGVMLSEPRRVAVDQPGSHLSRPRGGRNRMLIECTSIRDGADWLPAVGRLYVTAPGGVDAIHAGDGLQVWGRLRKIGGPTNPGAFDFGAFYRSRRILCSVYCPHADCVSVIRPSHTGAWLGRLRSRLNALSWHYLPPDQASLAAAILLGNREQLSPRRRASFLETGTVHLLAISGLHVGILGCCFFALFRCGWLSRNACLLLTMVFVMFYAWLVEFRPPVVRASILIVLFCIARITGRSGLSYNVLALAAMVVLAINPTDLFSLGTQLSFLAVASIGFGNQYIFRRPSDPLQQLIESTRDWPVRGCYAVGKNLRAAFVVSGLIWLISIPLVAISFHVLAPVGLLVNPLIILPIAISLYAGITIFAFGDFVVWIANGAAVVCWLSLGFIELFVGWASAIPGGHFWTAGPPVVSVVIFYVLWVVFGLYPLTRVSIGRLFGLGVAWFVLGWAGPVMVSDFYRSHIERALTATFIDVGHGTAVLLELPNGKVMIYDCGSTVSAGFAARCVSDVLWYKGIKHIDAVVVSHADIDHFNALPELAERFSIGKVYLSPMMNQHPSLSVAEMKTALCRQRVAICEIARGADLSIDPAVTIEILSPAPSSAHTNDNSASIVMSIDYRFRRILLPGDLEKEGLSALLATPPTHFDLVMAAHHGSAHSAPDRFFRWATPDFVAVSCGDGKLAQSTVSAAHEHRCKMLSTEKNGAVEFQVLRDGTCRFKSFLDGGKRSLKNNRRAIEAVRG